MSWEEERKAYAERLRRLMDGIDAINGIQGNRLISPEMAGKLQSLREKAAHLYPRLKDGIFEIAVIGMEKAGKSSFVNAYLDRVILPTDTVRCTYTSTCVCHSPDRDRGEVEFYTRQDFDRLFAQKLAELGIPDADKYNMRSLGLEQYRQLYEKYATPDKRKLYENSLNKEIEETIVNKTELGKYIDQPKLHFDGDELEGEEFKSFITRPDRAMAVRNVTIYSTKLGNMKDARLHDVPGFDSPTAMHREQTRKKMANADVVIVIAKGDSPSLTLPALEMYTDSSDEYGCTVRDKIFVFANKIDHAATREEVDKNISATYKEWIETYKIVPQSNRHRFVFGSANAALGGRVPGGEESLRKMESLQMENGLKMLNSQLSSYYAKERLPALIKQVNQLRHDVETVFAALDKLNLEEDQSVFLSNEVVLKLFAEQQKKLKTVLEDMRQELVERSRRDKPLRKDITDKISACINEESYRLTEEEQVKIHKTFASISAPEQPDKLDGALRDQRFREMHRNFTSAILGSVVEQHDKVRNEILQRFIGSLGVDAANPGLEQLRKNTEQFCGLDKSEDEAYYNSLIERFARDLFEVQIQMRHGQSRLNKFKEEASNFFSLGVFYDQGLGEGDDNIRFYSPADSLLWRLILYPECLANGKDEEDATSETTEQVLTALKQKIKIENVGPLIEDLVSRIVAAKGALAWNLIGTALQALQKDASPANKLKEVRNLLEPLADDVADAGREVRENVFNESEYIADINKKHVNYNYKMVGKEFSADVKALRESLLKAFVPAINLDKAFLAKEVKILEEIMDRVASEDFQHYINDNVGTIERAKMAEIRQFSEQRIQDSAVMAHIKKILADMDSMPGSAI